MIFNTPIQTVFDALTDPNVFMGNDPIVSAVHIQNRRVDNQQRPVVEYDVIETPRLLWLIPFRLNVHAISTSNATSWTIQNVVTRPLQMVNTIALRAQNQQTLLSETIEMTASVLAINYSMRQAVLAHRALFQNLRQKLESA